jgi:hypothetical protein
MSGIVNGILVLLRFSGCWLGWVFRLLEVQFHVVANPMTLFICVLRGAFGARWACFVSMHVSLRIPRECRTHRREVTTRNVFR